MLVTLAGKTIAMCHGHERAFVKLSHRPDYDYVFSGHTHRPSDVRVGHCRLINPGALNGVDHPTVATLDLERDLLNFHYLE